MFEMNRWRTGWVVTLAVGVMACGDDPTGPSRDLSDVELANEDFAVLRAELVSNTDLTGEMSRVTAAVDTLGVPLPADLLGTALEWDDAAGEYVVTGQPGAPPDGLRFILYDRAATPIVAVGVVDVTADADAPASALGVQVEKDGITRLEYLIEQDVPEPGDVVADGFVTGGTRRVDFDVAQTSTTVADGFRLDLDYAFSLAERPLTLVLDYSLHLSLFAPSAQFVASFVAGGDELIIDFVQTGDNAIQGEVRRNGGRIMTVTDDGDGGPRFLGPTGDPLDPSRERAIDALFDFANDGLGFVLPYLIVREG